MRGIAAINLRARGRKLAGDLLDRYLSAGHAGFEPRQRLQLLAARPRHGLAHAFVSIHHNALIRLDIDLGRPHLGVAVHHGQLIFSRGDDQFLLPNPFVVEFVAMSNKKGGFLAI